METRRVAVLVAATLLVAPVAVRRVGPAVAEVGPVQGSAAVPLSGCYSPDNGNPAIREFSITPADVDARNAERLVEFKVVPVDVGGPGRATGVAGGYLTLRLSAVDSRKSFGTWKLRWNGQGALELSLPFGSHDLAATWYVSVLLWDGAGNTTKYETSDLVAAGLPASFTSLSAAGPDYDKPVIRAVHLSATAVDVRRHRAKIAIRVHATDDSGVANVSAWVTGTNFLRSRIVRLRLRKGSPSSGQWFGTIVVPRIAGTESARLIVEAWDYRGRHLKYLPKGLAEIGSIGRVRVVGRDDVQRPQLANPTVSTSTIDLRRGGQKVTVRVRITDRGTGVRDAFMNFSGSATNLEHQGYEVVMTRVAGTAQDGIWKATVTLPRCLTEAGVWSGTIYAFDYGLPGHDISTPKVRVLNNDIAPPIAELVEPVPAAGPVTVTFNENTAGVSTENTLLYSGSGADDDRPPDGPASLPGTWACEDYAGATVDCSTGPVRRGTFSLTTPLRPDADYTLRFNPEGHLGVTDMAGNPMVDLFTDTVWLSNDLMFIPR